MGFPSFNSGDVLTAADMNAVGLWRVTNCTVTSAGGTAATASNGVITIGTNNTSVTVSNAFSADYENYRIVLTGGSSSIAASISLQLGASATGYYSAQATILYASDTFGYIRDNNAASFATAGGAFPDGMGMDVTLYGPQAIRRTGFQLNTRIDYRTTGAGVLVGNGFHNVATSYTGFTIAVSTGSMTGGTIRVYGFRN